MSPNEFQLRAALRDGEGDSLDADSLIARADDLRRERRRRVNTVLAGAAAVALVVVCATGIVALGGNGSDGGGSSADVAGGAGVSASSAGRTAAAAAGPSGAASAPRPVPRGTSARQACPAVPAHYALPGGGGLGEFGSTDPLLPAGVTSVLLCGYPTRVGAERTTATLDGSQARSLIAALEAAPARMPTGRACPANIDYAGGTVELIGTTSSGAATRPVVITFGCATSQATNGTSVRYLLKLPDALVAMITPIPAKSTAAVSPGRITVSPVR